MHPNKFFTSLLILIYFIVGPVFADSQKDTKAQLLVESYLQSHKVDEHISAVALTMSQPAIESSYLFGSTSYDGQEGLTDESIFSVGSITKSFIAAIILQLERDPKLHFSIEDHIDTYFPEYAKWHDVTVKQLLNMTSGLDEYLEQPAIQWRYLANPYQEFKPAELVSYVYARELLFKPGSAWNYSNTNYILLGMLIEKLTGRSLTAEINDRIISPLHLQHTFYIAHQPDDVVKPYRVRGYMYIKELGGFIPMGTDVTDYTLSVVGAAGAIYTTPSDLQVYVKALFNPGTLLSVDEIKKLTTFVSTKTGQPIDQASKTEPGFGLGIYSLYLPEINKAVYSYEGNTLAGRAIYIYDKELDVFVSAAVNSSVDIEDDHLEKLALDAYSLITGSNPFNVQHQMPTFRMML